jgi:methionine aminotransferase
LKHLVDFYIKRGVNQYAPMGGVGLLRQRLASKIEKLYARTVSPDHEITITAGGTQALFTAITAFVQPNDEVILIEPAYDSYAPSIKAMGGKVVSYRLTPPQYQINWENFEQLISPKTKMIILNTPQNPTGKTLKTNDLEALARITEGSNILILSDEVYEHLVFDGQTHQSVLHFDSLWQRSLACYSFGKTFHSTGWKVGYVVAPELLMREFRKVHQFNVFSVNHPVQCAIADYLYDENTYLSLPNFYQKKRDFFLNLMKNSRLKPLICEGTYFQLFDYQTISDKNDFDFCKELTTNIGVATIPISVFYTDANAPETAAKIIRICFAKTEETLAKAAEKLTQL